MRIIGTPRRSYAPHFYLLFIYLFSLFTSVWRRRSQPDQVDAVTLLKWTPGWPEVTSAEKISSLLFPYHTVLLLCAFRNSICPRCYWIQSAGCINPAIVLIILVIIFSFFFFFFFPSSHVLTTWLIASASYFCSALLSASVCRRGGSSSSSSSARSSPIRSGWAEFD